MGNCFCIDNYNKFYDNNSENNTNVSENNTNDSENNTNKSKNNINDSENLENNISLEEIIDNYNKNNVKPVEIKFSVVRKNCIKFKV